MLRRITVLAAGLVAMMAAAPVAAGGGGCHGPLTDGAGTTVELSQACFSPTVLRVAGGDTVTWVNRDSFTHNVYSTALPGFGTENLEYNDSASITFTDAGVFPYVCTLHPGMVGAVVVGDVDTPPPSAPATITDKTDAIDASAAAPSTPGAANPELEQRLAAVEQSLLSTPAQRSSWPLAAVGLVAGLALGVLGSRWRRSA
jgi:plastocyanin